MSHRFLPGREGGAPGSLGVYDRGRTPYFASRLDPRFSYCLYVPQEYDHDHDHRHGGGERLDLVVLVHGTARFAEPYRDRLADFCERERAIVLAPLFPAGVTAPKELSSYKRLRHGGVDYDIVLLDMVAEVAERYRLRDERFLLHGFSGGGHFAHRFLYVHPERLIGVSIGAPGIVTLLDRGHDWWVGIRDFERVFGKALDLQAIGRVPVHTVVGAEDTETWEIRLSPGDSWWMPGAGRLAEANRIERISALAASLRAQGVEVSEEIVPGAAHDGFAMLPAVERRFAEMLHRARAAAGSRGA